MGKVEPTLLAAVHSAMHVLPSARSSFDAMVWAEVQKIIECDAAKLDTELAPSLTNARYATSETLGLWAIHDIARDRMAEATVISNVSKDAADVAKKTLLAAEAELKRQQAALNAVSLQQSSAEKKVQELSEAHAALERLRCPPLKDVPEPTLAPISEGTQIDANVHLMQHPIATPMEM